MAPVEQITSLLVEDGLSQSEVARELEISQSTVARVAKQNLERIEGSWPVRWRVKSDGNTASASCKSRTLVRMFYVAKKNGRSIDVRCIDILSWTPEEKRGFEDMVSVNQIFKTFDGNVSVRRSRKKIKPKDKVYGSFVRKDGMHVLLVRDDKKRVSKKKILEEMKGRKSRHFRGVSSRGASGAILHRMKIEMLPPRLKKRNKVDVFRVTKAEFLDAIKRIPSAKTLPKPPTRADRIERKIAKSRAWAGRLCTWTDGRGFRVLRRPEEVLAHISEFDVSRAREFFQMYGDEPRRGTWSDSAKEEGLKC